MVTRQNSQAGGRPGWVGGAAERGTGKKEKKMWQRVQKLVCRRSNGTQAFVIRRRAVL